MANPNSQDSDPPGDSRQDDSQIDDIQIFGLQINDPKNDGPRNDDPQHEGPHDEDPQDDSSLDDDSQNGPQNNAHGHPQNNPPHAQHPISSLVLHFSTVKPFQEAVMLKLNRLDFKNLRLAGIRTPISQKLLRLYLIPSKCDETLPGTRSTCPNTTRTVDEVKSCHGLQRDDLGSQNPKERWIEPPRLFKHVHGSNRLVQTSHVNEEGHFDSFNVCIRCHDRDTQLRHRAENSNIGTFHAALCQFHALQHMQHQPYNACRCRMFLDKYWRCHNCSIATLDELRARALAWKASPSGFMFDDTLFVEAVCPIPGCPSPPWRSGPLNKQVLLCKACTAIFPQL
ncbi:hypothetical protein MMC22_004724 [Lobaria immixta]|nr:hypothetical protein [Lobaria immixta]